MYLQINKLHKNFETKQGPLVVLKDINMDINRGEFICAVGASGSGKSTLLRQIAGLDTPTTGFVKIDGVRVEGPGPDRGMVFQHYTLFPWMNVQENTEFGLKLQGVSKKERREKASYYLTVVGLTNFAKTLPKELSGGMKQRVASPHRQAPLGHRPCACFRTKGIIDGRTLRRIGYPHKRINAPVYARPMAAHKPHNLHDYT